LVKAAVVQAIIIFKGAKAAKEDVDKFGAQALAKKLRNPRDIFWDIHTGHKLKHRHEIVEHRKKLEEERLKKNQGK